MSRAPKFSVGSKVTTDVSGHPVKARVVEVNPPEMGPLVPGIPYYKVVVTSRARWLNTTAGETFCIAEYALTGRP